MQPGDRLGRFDMLPCREGAARYAVNEDLDAGLAICGREPHVVGRAFVAECCRDRAVNLERARCERQSELRQRRRPFVAAVRHGPEVRNRQVAFSVLRLGRRRDGRGIRRPHRRGRHGIGGEHRVRIFDGRSEPGQPRPGRARMRQENSLR